MNIIGASSMAILGVALLVNKMGEPSIGVLASSVALYAVFAFVFAGTALALARTGSYRLQRGMLWTNWAVIGLWGLGFAEIFLMGGAALVVAQLLKYLGTDLASSLFFVVPEWVSIRALRSALASNS